MDVSAHTVKSELQLPDRGLLILESSEVTALLGSLARFLGFEPELHMEAKGLSGMSHSNAMIGRNECRKHAIVLQSGFEKCLYRSLQYESQEPLEVLEEESRRNAFFSASDIRSQLEDEGWVVDVLYFINVHSPVVDAVNLVDDMRRDGILKEVESQKHVKLHQGLGPLAEFPLSSIETNVVATGACLLKLADLTATELVELTSKDTAQREPSAISGVVARTSLKQYFQPPVDELLLGALNSAKVDWSEKELVLSSAASANLGHRPGRPELISKTALDDPLEVIMALRNEKYIDYEGEVTRILARGGKVVHRFKKVNRLSWHRKIANIVDLVKKLTGFAGGAF